MLLVREITKIFGPPGTGKTTRLIRIVESALGSGIPPERIAYVSFTKRAAQEAQERAGKRFGFSKEQMVHFSTIHSMAFRQLGLSRDEIMSRESFKELCHAMNFKFTGMEDEYAHLPTGSLLGDKCIRIESLARLRAVSLKEQWIEESEYDCPFQAVEQWSRGLNAFKESRGLLDYTDLLERYSGELDVDIFIVDEAQDLSPLQWKVVSQASRKAKKIYLAGDDDQCIYAWAGAEVSKFLHIRAKVEVLPRSFRLPSKIYNIANRIARNIQERQDKHWSPVVQGGEHRRLRYEDSLDFRDKASWMLLARNRATLKRYERVLISQGYPYNLEGKSSVDNSAVRSILAWERARRGHPTTVSIARDVGLFLGQELALPMRGEVDLSRCLADPALLQRNWMEALTYLPAEKREYYRACLANGESLVANPRIQVSTIHRVKGGEADNVVLIPDMSAKPFENVNEDSEQRVLYVAVTRAKQTLTTIAPHSLRHFQI
jgi:DNA helicase-2/ATP-dependent DNA helicase PcrA